MRLTTYDPNDPRQLMAYFDLAEKAKQYGRKLQAGFHSEPRTRKQNRYYHLVLRFYASQIGITETDAEKEFKFDCEANRDKFVTYVTDSKGNEHTCIRSSADLSKEEMDSCIRNFLAYAEIYAGIIIPYENEEQGQFEAQKEIEKVNQYI